MATINVTTDEARLIAVYRAIQRFGTPQIISATDVGDAVEALEATTNLEKLEADDKVDMDVLLDGFIAGLAAARLSQLGDYIEEHEPDYDPEEGSQTISGGPTGGVVAGQGQNPNYVPQTGRG